MGEGLKNRAPWRWNRGFTVVWQGILPTWRKATNNSS